MTSLEARARESIDQLLNAAGWVVQDRDQLNLRAARGVALREFPLQTGFADYLLFVDRKALGAIPGQKVRLYEPHADAPSDATGPQDRSPMALDRRGCNPTGSWPCRLAVCRGTSGLTRGMDR